MRLYANCKNCGNELSIRKWVSTRVELAMLHGEELEIQCDECLMHRKYPVDDLHAKESLPIMLISFVVFISGEAALGWLSFVYLPEKYDGYYVIGGFLLIPVVIYRAIQMGERKRINRFNRSNLKSTRDINQVEFRG